MHNPSKYFRSQYRQDQITDILLNQKINGFFVDIGANDGVSFSNSYFFEKERKWDGICIEPIPSVFEKLKKNRSCVLVNGVVSTIEGDVDFTHISGHAEMLSGVTEYRDALHIERTMRDITKYGGRIKQITCKSYNLNKQLKEIGITKVDYLSIDIEGGEFEVLSKIDFSKIKVELMTIENNYGDNKIRELLEQKNFIFLFKYKSDEFYSSKISRGFRLHGREPQLFKLFLSNNFKIFRGYLFTLSLLSKFKKTLISI